MTAGSVPVLYGELAGWFHLLTHPAEYEEEAAEWLRLLERGLGRMPATVLELGSGDGNNASHMKAHVRMTLSDLSPAMLALSRRINPDLEHVAGDMRTLGERHRCGLFPRATWLALLRETGFEAEPVASDIGGQPFLARRRR